MVTVKIFGKVQIRQVSLEEAQKIVDETYNNPTGGIVVDGKTHETVSQLGPDTEEIIIIEEMLGGG
jgi:hypothetical protein